MNLDSIPHGASVLVDANLAIYARRNVSDQCQRLLERCASRDIHGSITAIALAEFCHRRMMQEAQSLGLVGSNPAKALGYNNALVQQLHQYRRNVQDLLAEDLTFISIDVDDFPRALKLQQQYGLLTNDSLHLAAGLRNGLTILATNDDQFDQVPDITVFKPDDVA